MKLLTVQAAVFLRRAETVLLLPFCLAAILSGRGAVVVADVGAVERTPTVPTATGQQCLSHLQLVSRKLGRDLGNGYVVYQESYGSGGWESRSHYDCLHFQERPVGVAATVSVSPSRRYVLFKDAIEGLWVLMDANGDRGILAPMDFAPRNADAVAWDEPRAVVRVERDDAAPIVIPLKTVASPENNPDAVLQYFRSCLDQLPTTTETGVISGCAFRDVGLLRNLVADDIISRLGEPRWCLGADRLNYLSARECRGSKVWGYSFYRLPPMTFGGGPELRFEFDEEGRAKGQWVRTQ